MCRDEKLLQFLHISPFFLVSLGPAYHILKFSNRGRERFEIIHRENLVETLFEGLNLDLHCFMEDVVHG